MTYYIRGRCEDGTVYARVIRGEIKSWHNNIEDATWFHSLAVARAAVNRYPTSEWVFNVRVTER